MPARVEWVESNRAARVIIDIKVASGDQIIRRFVVI